MRAVLALLAMTSVAEAGGVDFRYENFYFDANTGRTKIILRINNTTQSKIDFVIAECAFLNDDEKAMDTVTVVAANVLPGVPAYADGWSARMGGITKAACRIAS